MSANRIKSVLLLVAFFSVAAILLYGLPQLKKGPDRSVELTIRIFPSGTGWGYSIAAGHHVMIRQSYIPAASGFHAFESRQQARETAKLVVQKIKRGQIPSVTRSELDSLGVVIN